MSALLLFTLLACRTTPLPDPAAVSDEVIAEPAAAPEAERRSLTLDPRALSWDEEAGTATFSPGSDRQSASYEHYVFDLAALEAALGGRPDAPVDVLVEVISTENTNYTPEDPSMPSPDGGFDIATHQARVVGSGSWAAGRRTEGGDGGG